MASANFVANECYAHIDTILDYTIIHGFSSMTVQKQIHFKQNVN